MEMYENNYRIKSRTNTDEKDKFDPLEMEFSTREIKNKSMTTEKVDYKEPVIEKKQTFSDILALSKELDELKKRIECDKQEREILEEVQVFYVELEWLIEQIDYHLGAIKIIEHNLKKGENILNNLVDGNPNYEKYEKSVLSNKRKININVDNIESYIEDLKDLQSSLNEFGSNDNFAKIVKKAGLSAVEDKSKQITKKITSEMIEQALKMRMELPTDEEPKAIEETDTIAEEISNLVEEPIADEAISTQEVHEADSEPEVILGPSTIDYQAPENNQNIFDTSSTAPTTIQPFTQESEENTKMQAMDSLFDETPEPKSDNSLFNFEIPTTAGSSIIEYKEILWKYLKEKL